MRDLARLAIAAFGRQSEGSGVVGVDVQRIRRALGLRSDPSSNAGGMRPPPDAPPPLDREASASSRGICAANWSAA